MRKRCIATLLALVAGTHLAVAQPQDGTASTGTSTKPKPLRSAAATAQALQQMQASRDELTKSNHDLLDLLKQQQQVLEDIQFDRRLQSRQISTLDERLEEALAEKQQLQEKVDSLEMQASSHPAAAPAPPTPTPTPAPDAAVTTGAAPAKPAVATVTPITMPTVTSVDTPDTKAPAADATPPPPATYLPPEGADNPPGVQQWHRLLTLKGTDNQQSDVFTVHGKVWRVLWHNQDKPGKLYANTSALFINAFPRDDTIPMKVSSKLGSGGDATELRGPGNYYLKIEASGGSWELAVEDFR